MLLSFTLKIEIKVISRKGLKAFSNAIMTQMYPYDTYFNVLKCTLRLT